MALDPLAIKNMALDEVPSKRIVAEDEASPEGEATALHYQPALEYLLEQYDWDFAVRRETLDLLEANDRSAEWAFAYAIPNDLLRPLQVLPFGGDLGVQSSPSFPAWGPWRQFERKVPFLIAGKVLFSDEEVAILEYISNVPEPANFSARFTRALAVELAARIVMPLKKDRARQGDLIKMAEVTRERAKADEMNRNQQTPRDFISTDTLVRSGALPWEVAR